MRLSNSYFFTLREDVKNEESKSGNLLVKAGYISKIGSGIYTFLPMGYKVLRNIENVIREEMNKSGAEELLMPSLIPIEYYEKSGRADKFGGTMFKLQDRYDRPYALGPTHEELFTTVAKKCIKSYKDMPFNLYQIANKYRDELRPRFGLIRVREFIMKDAYSFDKDEEGLAKSYQIIKDTYHNIMKRLGLEYRVVEADCGTMGGTLSEEFQAICNIGEDILSYCPSCSYSTNLEVGTSYPHEYAFEEPKSPELIATPNIKTIDDLSKFLKLPLEKIAKTLVYNIDDVLYAVVIPSSYEINETKLQKLLKATNISLATKEEVESISSTVGFVGPKDLSIPIIIDEDILKMSNFVIGANQKDYHIININALDFNYDYVADIKLIKEGDLCPKCGKKLIFTKGIEVGNIFKLGTKYSEAIGLNYMDEQNQLKPVVMGCYGIGLARIMASLAEQRATLNNLNWPLVVAPFKVAIIVVNTKDEECLHIAEDLYNDLKEFDPLLDDRNERVGIKFNDMELIGIPIKIVIGKNILSNKVEIKYQDETAIIPLNAVKEYLEKIVSNQLL